jgi:ubiquinone/menaquinone biosynthesis C-methylase UbiE
MAFPLSPEEQAAQLRKPTGKDTELIAEYMARQNRELYNAVFTAMETTAGNQVLEIGCGEAPLATIIVNAAENISYTGLDYSGDILRLAEKKHLPGSHIRFVQSEIAAMPFAEAQFDVILGVNILYFWQQPQIELTEIRRVLKPGGRLVLGYRPKDKMQAIPFTQFGFHLYTAQELEIMLEIAGFSIVSNRIFNEEPRLIHGELKTMEGAVVVCN